MAIRVYTRTDDNISLMRDINSFVKRDMSYVLANGPWILDSEGRMTLLAPRFEGRAFFRMTGYPGSGMLTFNLESAPDTYMEEEIYRRYHTEMFDFLYDRFGDRFCLLEQTPGPN